MTPENLANQNNLARRKLNAYRQKLSELKETVQVLSILRPTYFTFLYKFLKFKDAKKDHQDKETLKKLKNQYKERQAKEAKVINGSGSRFSLSYKKGENQKRLKSVRSGLQRVIIETLFLRDEIALLEFDDPDLHIQLDHLDADLKEYEDVIAETIDQSDYRRRLKRENPDWWWCCTHPRNKFDSVWTFFTIFFLFVSSIILVIIIPLFSAAGPTIFSSGVVLFTTVLTLVFGGDSLIKFFQGIPSQSRSQNKFMGLYKHELFCLLSFIVMISSLLTVFNKKLLANCFFVQGLTENSLDYEPFICFFKEIGKSSQSNRTTLERSQTNKLLQVKSEGSLLRAIAFDPNHRQAYFWLGMIYERRQDWNNALKYYELATQNGSSKGCTRLAILYLLLPSEESRQDKKDKDQKSSGSNGEPNKQDASSKAEKASNQANTIDKVDNLDKAYSILRRCESDVFYGSDDVKEIEEKLEVLDLRKKWSTLMAWIYLEQKLPISFNIEVKNSATYHDQINDINNNYGRKNEIPMPEVHSCLKAYSHQIGFSTSKAPLDIPSLWKKCDSSLTGDFTDPAKIFWRRKAKSYLENSP